MDKDTESNVIPLRPLGQGVKRSNLSPSTLLSDVTIWTNVVFPKNTDFPPLTSADAIEGRLKDSLDEFWNKYPAGPVVLSDYLSDSKLFWDALDKNPTAFNGLCPEIKSAPGEVVDLTEYRNKKELKPD